MAEPPQRHPIVLVVAGILVLIVFPLLWGGAMTTTMGPWMMGGWAGPGGSWWGVLSFLSGLLIVTGLGLIAVWAVRRGETDTAQRDDGAREILRRRFARGELTSEEYERMNRLLDARR